MPQLTENGIVVDRQEDIVSRVTAEWQASFGDDFDISQDSDARRIADPIIDGLVSLNELALAVYDGTDEARAAGEQLDSKGRLTGLERDPGSRSVTQLLITGDAGTLIPDGYIAMTNTTGARFRTTDPVQIPDTGAPAGTETVFAPMESEEIGAIVASADTITVPVSTVGGIASITNPNAATPGTAPQLDPAYRIARRERLVGRGIGTDARIFRDINAIQNVQQVSVLFNPSDVTDVNGIPPGHVRVVIFPALTSSADREAIALALANNQTGALSWDGTQSAMVLSRTGQNINVRYSFAVNRNVLFDANITTTNEYPANGDDLVRNQILKFFGNVAIEPDESIQRLGVGEDILVQHILCNVVETVPGIRFMTLTVGFKPGAATEAQLLEIPSSQIATIEDPADIVVTS